MGLCHSKRKGPAEEFWDLFHPLQSSLGSETESSNFRSRMLFTGIVGCQKRYWQHTSKVEGKKSVEKWFENSIMFKLKNGRFWPDFFEPQGNGILFCPLLKLFYGLKPVYYLKTRENAKILNTTLQSMMNTKLSKQRFGHCYKNGLIKTIQTIPHNLYVSFKLASLY